MDTTDQTIVRLLQRDGRLSHEQISREVHLSRPAVHDRIKRLESAGVIRGYQARADWEAIGLPVTAFILVRISGNYSPIAQAILARSDDQTVIEQCHRLAGDWCLLMETHSRSTVALHDFLDGIRAVPGVQSTMTTVSLARVTPDHVLEGATQ